MNYFEIRIFDIRLTTLVTSTGACLNLPSASLDFSPRLAMRFKRMSSFDC